MFKKKEKSLLRKKSSSLMQSTPPLFLESFEERVQTPHPEKQLPGLHIEDQLQENVLFEGLSSSTAKELSQHFHFRSIAPGEAIVEEGQAGECMFFILKGTVEIFIPSHECVVATLGSGAFFGEVALLFGVPRTASARTKSWCLLGLLTREDFVSVFQDKKEELEGFRQLARKRHGDSRREELHAASQEEGSSSLLQFSRLPGARGHGGGAVLEGTRLTLESDSGMGFEAFSRFLDENRNAALKADLSGCLFVTDEWLSVLCSTQGSLASIDVSFCPLVTGRAFDSLLLLSASLKTLLMKRCNGLRTKELVTAMQGHSLSRLETLSLSGSISISEAGLEQLVVSCVRVSSVDFSFCTGASDRLASVLASRPGLRSADLSHCSVGLAGLSLLFQSKGTRKLVLRGYSSISDTQFEALLSRCARGKSLDLRDRQHEDAARLFRAAKQRSILLVLF